MKVVRMTEAGRHFLEARDFVLRNRSGAREKGLQKNAGAMSTKRIFTMVMPGKIKWWNGMEWGQVQT
jgi:hypothetical protein